MTTKRKWKKSSPELIALFEEMVLPLDQAEPRKMFGYPCAFVNGNMFTGLHEENWILRLSEADREELKEIYGAKPFAPMGRVMREYLAIPKKILESPKLLQQWLHRSLAFTLSLPPKKPKK